MISRSVVPALALTAALLSACGGDPSGSAEPSVKPSGPDIVVPSNLDEVIASVNANAPTAIPSGKDRRILGADVSWPQCPKGMGIPEKRSEGAPMPAGSPEFVVFGLTNGPSFTQNPCLSGQVAWGREQGVMASAYAVISYPDAAMLEQVRHSGGPYDGSTKLGGLQNAGYAAATHALGAMRGARLTSPAVWLDVEPVPGFAWSSDTQANAAVVKGAAQGFKDGGVEIGYYSLPTMWSAIVGDLETGGAPEWRPAGATGMSAALERCGAGWSFGGGKAVLGQWVEDHRDRNVTCPGYGGKLGTWFTRLMQG